MDVIKVVEKLAELNLIRINKPIGNWYSIYCPLHNDGNEKRPSSGISIKSEVRNGETYPEGMFHCFACQRAMSLPDLVSEILKLKGLSSQSGLEWIKDNIDGFDSQDIEFEYLLPKQTIQQLNSKYAVNYLNTLQKKQLKYVSEEELVNYRYTIQYMYDRKLTDEIINKFDVGVDLNFVPSGKVKPVPCITFPVRDISGNTLFVYRRAIDKKAFYMPSSLEKPVYGLYELGDNKSVVVICESIFNALTCWVYGYPAIALFGTGTVSQIQTLKLLGVKEFVLGLDPDDAGLNGSKKLRKALKSVAIVRKLDIPVGKDINDLDKETFVSIFKDRL